MKIKQIEVYTIKELSEESRKKAIENYIDNNDYDYLSEYMQEVLRELLDNNTTWTIEDLGKVYYSLSNCQGDGAMFEGTFETESGVQFIIKHSGRYNHYNSKTIHVENEDLTNEEFEKLNDEINETYVKICKMLEKIGYDFIDNENDEDHILEHMLDNEVEFLIDGKVSNF